MRMLACALTLIAATAHAATIPEYEAVRASRPDGRTVTIEGLALVRDAFRFELRSGVIHLLSPVAGHTFAAVFIGDGTWSLTPASSAERKQLRLVTGETQLETMSDRFDRAVFFFTDRTAEELAAHAPVRTGAPNEQAVRVYEDYLRRQQRDAPFNLHLRVLGDLLNRPGRTDGVFLAPVDGRERGKVLLAVDPLGLSNLSPQLGDLGGEEVMLFSSDERKGGFWYTSPLAKEAVSGRGKPARPLADALNYEIDSAIDSLEMRGRATITFKPLSAGLRILPLQIDQTVFIRSATLETGGAPVPVAVLREELVPRPGAPAVGGGDTALAFPRPLAADAPVRVRLEYEGQNVIECIEGRCAVGARESWYPNLGTFVDLATYDLTFRYPRRYTLVSVGSQVSERVDGGAKITQWRSGIPIRVAGFNFGEFEKLQRKDEQTGIAVNMYTNREWSGEAKPAQADAINAARVATAFFGRQGFTELSVTQQVQSNFGQSWPSLVFLPTLALVTSTTLAQTNAIDPRAMASVKEFVKVVGWHELSHQWWGHHVGWQSYRDQWLSEGFAEFTGALTLEFADSRRSYDKFWSLRRGEILDRRGVTVAPSEAGAITQGFRLATERSPSAAQMMLYGKGGFVLHMLRMMMREDKGGDPDRAFKAMMTDFAATWAGKSPSTDDFQRTAEKHMLPAMDLTKNRRLDWFFQQWVHGTDIPELGSSIQVADLGGGKYRISGAVTQAGVPADFHTLVPVYLDFGDDKIQRLGTVHLNGPSTQNLSVEVPLPQKPRRVVINARNDVLSR